MAAALDILQVSFLRKTCLVICGDDHLRLLVSTSLHQIGFPEVTKANNIEEALKRLSQSFYDVVICADTDIERLINSVQRLREHIVGATLPVPVICLTSRVDPAHLSALQDSRPSCIMTLPIGLHSMLKGIDRVLNDRPKPKSGANKHAHSQPRGSATAIDTEPARDLSDQRDAVPSSWIAGAERSRATSVDEERLPTREATILKGAQAIAETINHLKQALNTTDDVTDKKSLREQMTDAAQRLVNLMGLANTGGGQDAQSGDPLGEKLHIVKTAFLDVLAHTVQFRLETANSELEKYLRGKEIVVGYAEALSTRLAEIEEIITVIGGKRALEPRTRRMLTKAWHELLQIQEEEQSKCNLAELSPGRGTPGGGFRVKSKFAEEEHLDHVDAVDNQDEVMRSLKDRTDTNIK